MIDKLKLDDMVIVMRKIEDLIAAEYNPRSLSKAQYKEIKDSMKRFGFADPVIVNKHPDRSDIIIGGHQRIKVWQDMGNDTVPTVEQNLALDLEKELNVRLNKNTGGWDFELLGNNYEKDDLMEWGFTEKELGFEIEEGAQEDDYDMPDNLKTNIVLGDVIEIGPHKVLCGDSTQTDAWAKLCGEHLFDLVVTDPPYNVDYTGKTKDKLKIDNDKKGDGEFYQFLYDFYTALGSFTKAGGAWYVWHADSEGANFRKAMAAAGIMVKQCLIWVKQTMVMGRQDYQWKHEPCLYGWKEGASHGWYSDRKQTTVLNFDRPSRSKEHPTMKPVPLISYQITNSSKQGDLVGDGFLGSGTTMIACEQLGRTCYGIELSPTFCQVIVDRMLKLNSDLSVKINGKDYERPEEQK